MEHENTKFRETHHSNQPELIFPENYTKVSNTGSSSRIPANYLQDFHHLDHHHHHSHQFYSNNWSLAPNPAAFGTQAPCFDSFDAFPYGGGYSSSNLDFYECKPLIGDSSSNNGGHGQVMDNFQSCTRYLNNNNNNGENDDLVMNHHDVDRMMGSDDRRSQMIPVSFQDVKPVNFVIPDEVSCVNLDNNGVLECEKVGVNKNHIENISCRKTLMKGGKRSNVVKGQWTIEEDKLLVRLVEQYGIRKWSHIAQMLPGRIGKQCRERWHNHLRPDIKKDTWSEEEDKALIQAHTEIGNKWAEIAKRLPGRTENSIKNHWNATKRRQYSKRKCRSKYPRASILQEYIKSLNLDNNNSPYLVRNQSKNVTSTLNKNNNKDNALCIAKNKGPVYQHNAEKSNNNKDNDDHIGCCESDRLVPDFDFDDVPDFEFDDKLFQESYCSVDSLMDELPCAPPTVDEKRFDKEVVAPPLMEVEPQVKKELDLVEMISQANL